MKKDIEWLKEEIPNLRGYAVIIDGEDGDWEPITTVSMKDVYNLINQLDEPEVLSQELPSIPRFVAEWLDDNIERYKTVYSFIISLVEVFGDTVPEKVWTYASENPDTMARAYLDGYEVEKEQKYYVEDRKHTLLCKWESSDGWKVISTIESTEDDLPIEVLDFELTEQEIKDYDERFWPFAVKVEELEE